MNHKRELRILARLILDCLIAREVVQGNGFEDVQTEEVIF